MLALLQQVPVAPELLIQAVEGVAQIPQEQLMQAAQAVQVL